MKAFIHTSFVSLRPGDKKDSTIVEGEVVEGALAQAAFANGFGEEVPDDTPVGRELVERKAPPKAEKQSKRKRDREEGEGE